LLINKISFKKSGEQKLRVWPVGSIHSQHRYTGIKINSYNDGS